MTGWQPIETAPKDGTNVLLCWRAGTSLLVVVGRWYSESDTTPKIYHFKTGSDFVQPTHWMHLPEPPTEASK